MLWLQSPAGAFWVRACPQREGVCLVGARHPGVLRELQRVLPSLRVTGRAMGYDVGECQAEDLGVALLALSRAQDPCARTDPELELRNPRAWDSGAPRDAAW